eukprot:9468325-Pyramimonas_sp.AAC.1
MSSTGMAKAPKNAEWRNKALVIMIARLLDQIDSQKTKKLYKGGCPRKGGQRSSNSPSSLLRMALNGAMS